VQRPLSVGRDASCEDSPAHLAGRGVVSPYPPSLLRCSPSPPANVRLLSVSCSNWDISRQAPGGNTYAALGFPQRRRA
jgi:hypothetical protein